MVDERDEFVFRLNKLMDEKFFSVQLNMLLCLIEDLNRSYGLLPFEATAYFLGHSFRESFNTIDTNKNGLRMKLMLRTTDRVFIGEVIFLLMAIGKIKTLQWLYTKSPDIFKETNLERILKEISDGDARFRYWAHNLVFWEIGKMLK
jgi:hypothetical protein